MRKKQTFVPFHRKVKYRRRRQWPPQRRRQQTRGGGVRRPAPFYTSPRRVPAHMHVRAGIHVRLFVSAPLCPIDFFSRGDAGGGKTRGGTRGKLQRRTASGADVPGKVGGGNFQTRRSRSGKPWPISEHARVCACVRASIQRSEVSE